MREKGPWRGVLSASAARTFRMEESRFPARRRRFPGQFPGGRSATGILRLSVRRTPAPVQQIFHKTIVQQTVRKTVLHIHKTAEGPRRVSPGERFRPVLPTRGQDDPSRPTRTARWLSRIFSQESVRRELRPFFSGIVRTVLREERERYKSRPAQALSLVRTLFGRREAFWTLSRFYLGVIQRRGPVGSVSLPVRYTFREQAVPEELRTLSPARRTPLPPPLPVREPEEETVSETRAVPRPEAPAAATTTVRLSETEFRALARDVAGILRREDRLEAIRRGRG